MESNEKVHCYTKPLINWDSGFFTDSKQINHKTILEIKKWTLVVRTTILLVIKWVWNDNTNEVSGKTVKFQDGVHVFTPLL